MTDKERIEKLEKLLKPFADVVFNDNGDVTYNFHMAKNTDYWAAYWYFRDKWLEGRKDAKSR